VETALEHLDGQWFDGQQLDGQQPRLHERRRPSQRVVERMG
jgi:hypothetical protein